MIQRLVTGTWLLNTEILPVVQRRGGNHTANKRLQNRTEVHFQFSAGPRSHNAKTGYTTMSKAKGIKHSYDTKGCTWVCERDRERDRLWVHTGFTVWNTGLYSNIATIHRHMTVQQSSQCLCGQGVLGTCLKIHSQKASSVLRLSRQRAAGHLIAGKTQQCDVHMRLFPSAQEIFSVFSASRGG